MSPNLFINWSWAPEIKVGIQGPVGPGKKVIVGGWNKAAWQTDAFYGNPLLGSAAQ